MHKENGPFLLTSLLVVGIISFRIKFAPSFFPDYAMAPLNFNGIGD